MFEFKQSYMEYALQKLNEEDARATKYLETQLINGSVDRLMRACIKTFVIDYKVGMDNLILPKAKLFINLKKMLFKVYNYSNLKLKYVFKILFLLDKVKMSFIFNLSVLYYIHLS